MQLEAGTSRTAYQRVLSNYDVTETGSGSLWHLYSDLIDDALSFTPSEPLNDATVWYATEAGITIETGQTLPAAPLDILKGQRTFVFGAFDRALTTVEHAALTRYLKSKGAPYA